MTHMLSLSLSFTWLGWGMFILGCGFCTAAGYCFLSTFRLKSRGDYDFGTPISGLIRILLAIIFVLVAALLFTFAK